MIPALRERAERAQLERADAIRNAEIADEQMWKFAHLADELAGALGRLSDVAEVLLANYDLRSIEDKDFEWLRAQLQFVDHASGERGAFAALSHYRKETDSET